MLKMDGKIVKEGKRTEEQQSPSWLGRARGGIRCYSVCEEGEERKVDSDSNMKFKPVKVQCNLQKEMPKFGNSNLDVIQLQLEQEEI
ncbi:hypothetical protein AAES_147277 [Amazona aestiva]|uniref:Uncharacterized protein n=1 Tax=Amazona aestiva TaxID=12930 RepID=A0A0Q3T403_AMAAE|nr:hypothetical protein AAES_147277 [Amazona aestiva]